MVQGQKETLSDSEQENKLLLHDPNIIARWQLCPGHFVFYDCISGHRWNWLSVFLCSSRLIRGNSISKSGQRNQTVHLPMQAFTGSNPASPTIWIPNVLFLLLDVDRNLWAFQRLCILSYFENDGVCDNELCYRCGNIERCKKERKEKCFWGNVDSVIDTIQLFAETGQRGVSLRAEGGKF